MPEITPASVAMDALLGSGRELIAARPDEDPHDVIEGWVLRFTNPSCLRSLTARLVVALLDERARAESEVEDVLGTLRQRDAHMESLMRDGLRTLRQRDEARDEARRFRERLVKARAELRRLRAAAVLTPDAPELPTEGSELAKGGPITYSGPYIVGESGCTLTIPEVDETTPEVTE